MNRTPVIVIPADNVIALSVIRSLGREGYLVIAISTGNALAHTSRYCSRVIFEKPPRFADAVLNAARESPGSLVICLGEVEIEMLNERRAELATAATLLFPDSAHFALALQKERTIALARQALVPFPETVDLAEDHDLLRCRGLNFPVVIKPRHQDLLPFKVKYAPTFKDLAREVNLLGDSKNFLLVQEQAKGYGVGIEMLIRDKKTVLAFQHRRIREDPPSGGVSVCCESEPLDTSLVVYAENLLAAMDWDGVAMVEFKVDPATGLAALMEVNGRFWGSLPLAIHAGADFPAALVRSHLPGAFPRPQPYRVHLRCRRLIGETKWLVRVLRDGTVPVRKAVAAYLRDFRPGVCYYIWTWDDPWPAIYALLKRVGLTKLFGRG